MRRLALICAALVALVPASAAHASGVTPLITSDQLRRVHELVPLGADGAHIAMVASFGGQYLQDSVFAANADGSELVRLDDGRVAGITDLRASADGTRLAWHSTSYLAVATASGSGWQRTSFARSAEAYAFGADGTLYMPGIGLRGLLELRPDAHRFARVPSVGLSTRRGDYAGTVLTSSVAGSTFGACVSIQRRGSSAFQLGLGLLDSVHHVLRFRTTRASFGESTEGCSTSDDGRTVAMLASIGRQRFVVVRHGRRLRAIRVPAAIDFLRAISLSGRYLLVAKSGSLAGSYFHPQETWAATMEGPVALVDTTTGRVRTLRGLNRFAQALAPGMGVEFQGRVVWSPHESYVAMAPNPQGTLVASTRGTADAFIPSPQPPSGTSWVGTLAQPVAFSRDERRVVFTLQDSLAEVTGVHPYSAPVTGGPPTPLLSDSMRSFGSVVVSADGRSAWLSSSVSCREVYPVALFSASLPGLFETPFTAPDAPGTA